MKTYAWVLAALLGLTAITVAAAGIHFSSPTVNVVAALGIATLKASLVALFFMHLRHDKPMNALIFLVGLAVLGSLLMLTLVDVQSRFPIQPATSPSAASS
jgi:cytochrome c oxidase subunit 4